MTREAEQAVAVTSMSGAGGQREESPTEPRAVPIKMPNPDPDPPERMHTPRQAKTRGGVNQLLQDLIDRLDESDRRNGDSSAGLNEELNTLTQRAQALSGQKLGDTAAALDRLREQASSFAEQVDAADGAHKAQRSVTPNTQNGIGHAGGSNNGLPGPDTGDGRLNRNIADASESLERSLSSRQKRTDFAAPSQRMDQLAQRLDAACGAENDVVTLKKLESQLNALTSAFADAQQTHAKVNAIERHLLDLMRRTESTGVTNQNGSSDSRMAAIEQALKDLSDSSREMNSRTVSALKAMNQVLHLLASQARGRAALKSEAAPDVSPKTGAPPKPAQARKGVRKQGAHARTERPPSADKAQNPRADLSASRPNAPGGAVGNTLSPSGKAAARLPASAGSGGSGKPAHSSLNSSSKNTPKFTSETIQSDRRRPVLIAVVALLLIISAGLLYSRLKTSPEVQPAVEVPQKSEPESLMSASRKSRGKTTTPMPATADSRPISPQFFQHRQEARPDRIVGASIPRGELNPQPPDVTMEIREAPPRKESTRTGHRAGTPTPAFAPPMNARPQRQLLPQPKRTPGQKRQRDDNPANVNPVGSAPSNENTENPGASREDALPVRIGPQSLRVAAARGNPAAQVEVGLRYAKGHRVPKNLEKAAEWYGRAAAQGHAPAQYRLAVMYERGAGVKKDSGIARAWYRRAAELGNIRAMHNLAVLYMRRGATGPDYTSAKKWFHAAARHGLTHSQFNLGILLESGLGTDKNKAEAYKWFSIAARQGDADALKRREALRTRLTAESLAAAETAISSWRKVPADKEANRIGAPRGGWQKALGKQTAEHTNPALIARAQKLLNKIGFDAGAADGRLGPQTKAAIREFEARSGIDDTGSVTPALLRRLEALAS